MTSATDAPRMTLGEAEDAVAEAENALVEARDALAAYEADLKQIVLAKGIDEANKGLFSLRGEVKVAGLALADAHRQLETMRRQCQAKRVKRKARLAAGEKLQSLQHKKRAYEVGDTIWQQMASKTAKFRRISNGLLPLCLAPRM